MFMLFLAWIRPGFVQKGTYTPSAHPDLDESTRIGRLEWIRGKLSRLFDSF